MGKVSDWTVLKYLQHSGVADSAGPLPRMNRLSRSVSQRGGNLKLPEKTGCKQAGNSLTARTKSPLPGAAGLWSDRDWYAACVLTA